MTKKTNELGGKIALVSGASRGIGRACAAALGRTGASIIGTATTEKGAKAITEFFKTQNIHGEGMVLDVNDFSQIDALVREIDERFGGVDILINNAGITRDSLLLRMKDEAWRAVIDTNLGSIYKMSQAVLRTMLKKKSGRIISIASVVGAAGNAGQANYGAAKAGIIGFTKSLAREVAARGITVNAVAPGFIETDMTASLTDEQKKQLSRNIPAGRLGRADEVAELVVFLASAKSAYITAQTLHINGGMYTV